MEKFQISNLKFQIPARRQAGFTLIELLIVIAIIGILVIGVIAIINPLEVNRKARDVQRIQDIRSMDKAMDEYILNGNPAFCTSGCNSKSAGTVRSQSCSSNWLGKDLCAYMKLVPVDPINTRISSYAYGTPGSPQYAQGEFFYSFQMTSNNEYKLEVRQESGSNLKNLSTDGGGDNSVYESGSNLSLSPSNASDGLVGWWKFDEGSGTTAADSSGNGNTGTLTNGPTWVNGKVGKALQLDGSDDYVIVPDADSLDVQSGDMTLSSWVYPIVDGAGQNGQTIAKDDCGDANIYQVRNNGGSYQFRMIGPAPTYQSKLVTTSVHALGVWHHVVAVKRGTTTEMYVDGALEATGTAPSGMTAANAFPVYFGTRGGSVNNPGGCGVNYLKGLLDENRIYNRALSATEVKALYDAAN